MPQKISDLILHLSNNAGITANRYKHELALTNIGYYHGYKGYRFFRDKNNTLNISNFNEIIALNEFDLELKSVFYKQIMFIELGLKNRLLYLVMDECGSKHFGDIYDQALTYYLSLRQNSRKWKNAIQRRLDLRNKFLNTMANKFDRNKIVTHFYENNYEVPIWGIFELISLGEFAHFVSCLNVTIKSKTEILLNIDSQYSSDGGLTEKIIYLIKDLRNALSHNEPIFDVRFKQINLNQNLSQTINLKSNISGIDFEHITDYLVLIIYLLKVFEVDKNELNYIVDDFNDTMVKLKYRISASDFMKIFPSDTLNKLSQLKAFIKR